MSIERPRPPGALRRRAVPTLVTFLVVAGGVYATAYVALSLLRHVVMPIVAVVVGGYAARSVYRLTARNHDD